MFKYDLGCFLPKNDIQDFFFPLERNKKKKASKN